MARSLEFSDQVANLADRVIHGMTMGGKNEYNAVHLRIEKDARDWSQIMGGEQVLPHHILLIIKTVVLIIIIVKIKIKKNNTVQPANRACQVPTRCHILLLAVHMQLGHHCSGHLLETPEHYYLFRRERPIVQGITQWLPA